MKVFKFLHIPTAQYVKMWSNILGEWVDVENPSYGDAIRYINRVNHYIIKEKETLQIRKVNYLPLDHVPKHEISIVEVEHESDLLTGHLTKHVS